MSLYSGDTDPGYAKVRDVPVWVWGVVLIVGFLIGKAILLIWPK